MTVRVAATMRSVRAGDADELRDSLSRDWTAYLDALGCTVVPVPNGLDRVSATLTELAPDALILTNGEDLGAHEPRDRTEEALIDTARERSIPVLGVCRGHQFLNHYFGGDVVRIEDVSRQSHAGIEHDVTIDEGPAADVLPARLNVNSYHEWGVIPDNMASDLRAFARSDDGVVEALYHPDEPLLTIQWHPERPLPERDPVDALVGQFLEGELRW